LRSRWQGARLSGPALGRSAAARRDRTDAGHEAPLALARRGDERSRPRARRRGAERHPRAGRRRNDDADRHARDELRARDRRTGLLPRRGRDPRGGAAARNLRVAARTADSSVPAANRRGRSPLTALATLTYGARRATNADWSE